MTRKDFLLLARDWLVAALVLTLFGVLGHLDYEDEQAAVAEVKR